MSHEAWGAELSGTDGLTKQEREKLLFKLNRLFIFIGCEIPDKIELEGKNIPLHELIWKIIISKEPLSPEELAAVDKLYRDIEKKIHEDELKIKSADISKTTARELSLKLVVSFVPRWNFEISKRSGRCVITLFKQYQRWLSPKRTGLNILRKSDENSIILSIRTLTLDKAKNYNSRLL